MKAPNTRIDIIYEGRNISRDIAPYLLTFSFTDNSSGKADDISLTLQDSKGTWLNDWMPSKGDTISASIVQETSSRVLTLPCGSFTVDEIDFSEAPAVFTIKGVSASVRSKAAQQKHTRFWENVTLREVISDLAGQNSLNLFIDADTGQRISRVDQTQQSDLDFLEKLCGDYGLNVKIQKDRIVVYDAAKYEEKSAVQTITRGDEGILSAKFSSKSAKVFKKARVKYHDPVKAETYIAEEEDDDIEGSERELEIYERVESQADAGRVAKERLAASNRQEITGTITLRGNVSLAAGQTITFAGYGMFSGKHFISQATHKVDSSGYTVSLTIGKPKAEKAKSKAKKQSRKSSAVHQELFYEGADHY